MANIIGVVKRIAPPHIVPIQLKILTPVGTAISMVLAAKNDVRDRPEADREHVVAPHAEAEEADGDRRRPRTGSRRAASCEKIGRISETMPMAGQDQDVHLGVTEDPEQVLPEQRVAAARRVVEVRAEEAVEHQQDAARW